MFLFDGKITVFYIQGVHEYIPHYKWLQPFFFIMIKNVSVTEHKVPIHVSERQITQSFNAAHIWDGTLSRPEQISLSFILSFFSIFFLSFYLQDHREKTNISLRNCKKVKVQFPGTMTHRPHSATCPNYVHNSLPSEAARSTSSREFYAFYRTRSFVTLLTTACERFLSRYRKYSPRAPILFSEDQL